MASRRPKRRCSHIRSYWPEKTAMERQPAAEGQIPWKGLKHDNLRRRDCDIAAAEGQIPWKGLKHLRHLVIPGDVHLAAEGQIPWKGLKRVSNDQNHAWRVGRRRADSLEGIET